MQYTKHINLITLLLLSASLQAQLGRLGNTIEREVVRNQNKVATQIANQAAKVIVTELSKELVGNILFQPSCSGSSCQSSVPATTAQETRPTTKYISSAVTHKDYIVSGIPYDANIEDTYISPFSWANNYGSAPEITMFVNQDSTLSVCWNTKGEDNFFVKIVEFDKAFHVQKQIEIPRLFPRYGGFTKDEHGNYYLLFYSKGNNDGVFNHNMVLGKFNAEGAEMGKYYFLTDREKGWDIKEPMANATSRLLYANGKIAVITGKIQHKNVNDGLNHQQGIFGVVDAQTMTLIENQSVKWTASHSFDQRLIFDGKDFVTLERADNYPRGFAIRKKNESRNIFPYKTIHSYEEKNPAGKVLGSGKWANDNATYSELGGLESAENGYIVLGSSEKEFESFTGKRDQQLKDIQGVHNLFMVLVNKRFEKQPLGGLYQGKQYGNIVHDSLVISTGENSDITHAYSFVGDLSYCQRKGVIWLTNYKDKNKENVCRPKLVKVGEDKFVALWEKWTSDKYVSTYYLIFNTKGEILKPATDVGTIRLNRGDDVVAIGKKVLWVTGNKFSQKLILNQIDTEYDDSKQIPKKEEPIIVYTQNGCGRCERTIDFLKKNHIKYIEKPTSNKEYNSEMWVWVGKSKTNRTMNITMPVIIKDEEAYFSMQNLDAFLIDLKE